MATSSGQALVEVVVATSTGPLWHARRSYSMTLVQPAFYAGGR